MPSMGVGLQAARLRACEETIERGQQTFIEVGQALARIRDERLFREAGFASFDAYCRERWAMGKSYASQLISAASVGAEFRNLNNEGQAHALRRVPETQRAEVMERVQERAESESRPITAALIEEVARPQEPKPEPRATCQHCEIHCPSGWHKRKD